MSDSDESGVTHTEVSSPFEDLSDIGSPRADDHELLELPYMPEDPYLEAALQAPPSPDYPYAEDASPIAQSPDYISESDPEADPEEDDDEDPKEDPIDYPADGGDDGDDEMDIEEDEDDDMDIDADEEDEDDEMDVEIDEEAEEEHSAPAYPVVVALPATAPSAEETEPFETDESAATPPPHPAYRMTARITIPEPLPVPAWSDSEVARLLAISSPPASPLSPWSSSPPQIPFPLSPPSPVLTAPPPSPIRSLGYRAATIRMRAEAAATSHSLPLPPPFILSPTRPDAPPPMPTSAPTSFPPLLLPSASHREDRPERAQYVEAALRHLPLQILIPGPVGSQRHAPPSPDMCSYCPSAEEMSMFVTDEYCGTPPPHHWLINVAISSQPATHHYIHGLHHHPVFLYYQPPSPVVDSTPLDHSSHGLRAATIRMRAKAAATSHSLPYQTHPPSYSSPSRQIAPPPAHIVLLLSHCCLPLPVIERIEPEV
ncbi:hypothetical protein Tco_0817084 [Tanacetum coccineum]